MIFRETETLELKKSTSELKEAIREALVNSFCHRDYWKPESNKIAIFKNRIEIYNPGLFPEGLTPEDFIRGEEQSILRNPLIAELTRQTGLSRRGIDWNIKKLKSNGVLKHSGSKRNGQWIVLNRKQ